MVQKENEYSSTLLIWGNNKNNNSNWFFSRHGLNLGADDVGGPIATAADGIEGQIGRALVLPTGNAVPGRPPATHDELPAGVRMGEHTNVMAEGAATGQNFNL